MLVNQQSSLNIIHEYYVKISEWHSHYSEWSTVSLSIVYNKLRLALLLDLLKIALELIYILHNSLLQIDNVVSYLEDPNCNT